MRSSPKPVLSFFRHFAPVFASMCLVLTTFSRVSAAQEAVVETAMAKEQVIGASIWVPGTVISRQDSRIAAEVSGNLLAVADVGDRIEQGQIIAQVNDRLVQLQLRDDEAQIKRLESSIAFTRRQLARIQSLAQANNSSESELDRLQMEKETLVQELAVAQVNRDRSLYDIERSVIRAPFSGVIVERVANPGEYIEQGRVVVRLVNVDDIEVRAQAPISISRFVKEAALVQVRGADMDIETPVRRLVPVGEERSRMLEVRVQLHEGSWIIGEAVQVALANGPHLRTITVPRDALILRESQAYVYKISEDNTAKRVSVAIGESDSNGAESGRIAVEGELKAGDKIVIRGGERLRDGQAVKLLDASLAKPSSENDPIKG